MAQQWELAPGRRPRRRLPAAASCHSSSAPVVREQPLQLPTQAVSSSRQSLAACRAADPATTHSNLVAARVYLLYYNVVRIYTAVARHCRRRRRLLAHLPVRRPRWWRGRRRRLAVSTARRRLAVSTTWWWLAISTTRWRLASGRKHRPALAPGRTQVARHHTDSPWPARARVSASPCFPPPTSPCEAGGLVHQRRSSRIKIAPPEWHAYFRIYSSGPVIATCSPP